MATGNVGSGGRAVESWTINRGDGSSIPSAAVSKLRQFLNPTFVCLSAETLKAGVYAREVKYPTQGVNMLCVVDSLILEKDNSKSNDNNGQQVDRGHLLEEEMITARLA